MARYTIEITEPWVHVVPATELISTPMTGGPSTKIADIAEERREYPAGKRFFFRNKKERDSFLKLCPVKTR